MKLIRHPVLLILVAALLFAGGFGGGLWQIGFFSQWEKAPVAAPLPLDRATEERVRAELANLQRTAKELDKTTNQLKGRTAELDVREAAIRQQQSALETQKQALEALRNEIQKLRDDVDSRLVVVESSEDGNFQQLSKLCSTMTPENAAKLLATIPDNQAVNILLKMKQQQSAKVFDAWLSKGGEMTEKAKRMTDLLRAAITAESLKAEKTQ